MQALPLSRTSVVAPLFLILLLLVAGFLGARIPDDFVSQLIEQPSLYNDRHLISTWEKLGNRLGAQPFNIVSAVLFACAIVHTFFSRRITVLVHRIQDEYVAERRRLKATAPPGHPVHFEGDEHVSFKAEVLRFFGEVEVIFIIWVIPLMMAISYWFGYPEALNYINNRNYTEPLFVIVIMTLASTRPVIYFAERCLEFFSRLGGGSPAAWWFSILTIGPILGSFITEPAAMTISAYILARRFYRCKPNSRFAYATLGLLFVNVSVGGVLTHFAAPPVLMVEQKWHWDSLFMVSTFGWKAVIGIFVATSGYFLFFRKELAAFAESEAKKQAASRDSHHEIPVPFWITAVHILFLGWIVLNNHYPVVFIGTFLIFLGFHQATSPHQHYLTLKPPLLVGCFLAGLVIHGGLQGWWIAPLLGNIASGLLMKLAIVLTAFNDNAAITYLTTLIPDFGDALKYAVVAGAVTGGGLTVIANAPNPAGQSILSPHFEDGISPAYLFLGALFPTVVMYCAFAFL